MIWVKILETSKNPPHITHARPQLLSTFLSRFQVGEKKRGRKESLRATFRIWLTYELKKCNKVGEKSWT